MQRNALFVKEESQSTEVPYAKKPSLSPGRCWLTSDGGDWLRLARLVCPLPPQERGRHSGRAGERHHRVADHSKACALRVQTWHGPGEVFSPSSGGQGESGGQDDSIYLVAGIYAQAIIFVPSDGRALRLCGELGAGPGTCRLNAMVFCPPYADKIATMSRASGA